MQDKLQAILSTFFDKINIDFSKWLILIKMFDLGISARKASRESGVNYPIALRSFDTIRFVILEEQARTDKVLRGEIETDEAGILEVKEREIVNAVPKTKQSSLESWKEMEWRYNNRDKDTFSLLVDYMLRVTGLQSSYFKHGKSDYYLEVII